MRNTSVPRLVSWAVVLFALVTLALAYAMRAGKGAPAEAVSPAACQTMDGIFRPTGVQGKQQFLKHLIESSDRLALQTGGQLRHAAEVHASYVRRLSAEEYSAIPDEVHREGLKAYNTIREDARRRCSLNYLGG